MSDELEILRTLHRVISRALCDEAGHQWEPAVDQPTIDGAVNTSTAQMKFERCRVCNKTRPKNGTGTLSHNSSGISVGINENNLE